MNNTKLVLCLCLLPLLISGCSTVTAKKDAAAISSVTGIPNNSIQVAAKCLYAATNVGSKLGAYEHGIFVLTDASIHLHTGVTGKSISKDPVYKINFTALDSMAMASHGLNHQLHFYTGNRVFVVQLCTKMEGADKGRSLKVYNYMINLGVKKNPNTKVMPFDLPTPTVIVY